MEHRFQTDKVAQCTLEGDPDWWFDYSPGPDRSHLLETSQETRMAISICNRCDALDECRAWSLQYQNLSGVWGGLVPATRARLRSNMGIEGIDFNKTWGSPLSIAHKETA